MTAKKKPAGKKPAQTAAPAAGIEFVAITDLKPNPGNPRVVRDEKFLKLVASIESFPDMLNKRPLVVVEDTDGKLMVLGGNQRFRACQHLGLKEVPVIRADGWTEEQRREFVIKDNASAGEWDFDMLANEWDAEKLGEWNVDVWKPTEDEDESEEGLDDRYTDNVGGVTYEPTDKKHRPEDLFVAETKYDADIERIANPGIKAMLKARAAYLGRFNFSKIADYYANQATDEEKVLFEKLALVLLDRDQLIENGFADIIKKAQEETV